MIFQMTTFCMWPYQTAINSEPVSAHGRVACCVMYMIRAGTQREEARASACYMNAQELSLLIEPIISVRRSRGRQAGHMVYTRQPCAEGRKEEMTSGQLVCCRSTLSLSLSLSADAKTQHISDDTNLKSR